MNDVVTACFYPGAFPSGNFVRGWTRSPYGHCAIQIGGTVYEALGWRRKYPWWKGAVSKRPAGRFERECRRVPCPWADAETVRERAEHALGLEYDWPALVVSGEQKWFRGGFSLRDRRRRAYDCSRFVLYALGMTPDDTPTPQDAYEMTATR